MEAVHNPKAVYQDKVNILFSVSWCECLYMCVSMYVCECKCVPRQKGKSVRVCGCGCVWG